MSENTYSCFIDIEKVSDSVKALDSLDSCLNSVDLTDILVDIEDEIKKINFEHGSCFTNYKEYIDKMIDDLWDVKREVSKLNLSLSKTLKKYAKSNELHTEDLKELSNLYGEPITKINPEELGSAFKKVEVTNLATQVPSTDVTQGTVQTPENPVTNQEPLQTTENPVATQDSNQGTITKIPPVTTENPTTPGTPTTTTTSSEINTVPIGLGIAATGITASAGAVVVGTMKQKQKDNIPSYDDETNPKKEKVEETSYDELDDYEEYENEHRFVEVTPYHASRDKQVMNKFYGEETIQLDKREK